MTAGGLVRTPRAERAAETDAELPVLPEWRLRRLARTPLPLPPSPWPAVQRPGKHYAPLNKRGLPARLSAKLVGLSFIAAYPHNVDGLELTLMLGTPAATCLSLIREPDNPYDANAIRVDYSDADGTTVELGHFPAALAARLADELDAGAPWRITDAQVLRVSGPHVGRPGVTVNIERGDVPW